jgi:hypothetical protein
MRRGTATVLCLVSQAIIGVLAVATGIGTTVVLVLLAINGTISVGAAIVIFFVGLPLAETLIFWLAAGLAFIPLGIAKLVDREAVSEWLDSQPVDSY